VFNITGDNMIFRKKQDDEALISLKVKKAFKQDIGRPIVRIDPDIIKTRRLNVGDIVLLVGRKMIPGIVMPSHPTDSGKNLVRLSKNFRKNLKIDVGEEIRIKKVEVSKAQKVILTVTTPVEPSVLDRLKDQILNLLEEKPVIEGQEIDLVLPNYSHLVNVIVSYTKPKGIVQIDKTTKAGFDHIIHKDPISLLEVWMGEDIVVYTIGEVFEGKLAGFDPQLNIFLEDARIIDDDIVHKVLIINGANVISIRAKGV